MAQDTSIRPGQPQLAPLTAGPHSRRLGLVAVIAPGGRGRCLEEFEEEMRDAHS